MKSKIMKAGIAAGLIVILILIGVFIYQHCFTPAPVVTQSQRQAETPAGILAAANSSRTPISPRQADDIAGMIKHIDDTRQQPEYTVPTTGKDAKAVADKISKKEKADFTVITNPAAPDRETDLAEIPQDTKVELNQYNIRTAPKVLREISLGKDFSDNSIIIGAGIKKRISTEGKYVGLSVIHDTAPAATYAMITYSW